MIVWRYLQNLRDKGSLTRFLLVKKLRKTFKELECLILEFFVEYEELDFDFEQVFCFEDSYSEFVYISDVCVGVDREREDYEDDRIFIEGSSGDDLVLFDSDDEGGVGSDDDEIENLKKFVQESIFRLVEMKQKMGCFINYFEEFLKWGKDLYISGNINVVIYWLEKWDEV